MLLFVRYYLLVGLGLVSSTLSSPLVLQGQPAIEPPNCNSARRMRRDTLLHIRIRLRSSRESLPHAEPSLIDPFGYDSPQYDLHYQSLKRLSPSDETLLAVTAWLHSHGIWGFNHSKDQVWFIFDIPVKTLERMLNTEYFEAVTESGREAFCDDYFLPAYLQEHIDYISPGVRESVSTESQDSRPGLGRKQ